MAVEILVSVLTGLAMLIGLLGVLVPLLPDVILIWAAALGYGLALGWGASGLWFFAAISLVGVAALATEFWVSGIGAKMSGASIWAVFAGVVLGVAGFFLLGPIGALAGLLLGTFLAELYRLKEVKEAARAMLGTGLSCGASFGVKFLLAFVMFVIWIAWVIVG